MRLWIFVPLLLIGCQMSPQETVDVFIKGINKGDFSKMDDITGPNFLEERIERCKFLNTFSGNKSDCSHTDVLHRWDKYVRDLNLYMAPCRWEELVTKGGRGAADIVCGDHRDVFQLMEDDDGWRLRGTFEKNMVELEQKLIIEMMHKAINQTGD